MKYSSSVNNYRETPYIVSDTFANKVNYAATIKGAIYVARDGASLNEPSIFQANGTVWVAIGGYGIGTDATLQDVTTNGKTTNQGITVTAGGVSTNTLTVTSLTPKSIPFVGTADLITEDNTNLVWDNVNKWIGIQTNVPTAEVDIHTTTATPAIVINNTLGLASRIGFQNTNVSKWTIGNSATNTFNFYNSVLASIAAYFDGTNNAATFNGSVQVLGSGGQRDVTSNFNSGILDATATIAGVKAVARFSNQGSQYITKIILSDVVNADCAISFQPNTTIANSTFGIGINATPQFVLKGSGFVGIGESIPACLLNIKGPSPLITIDTDGTTNTIGGIYFRDLLVGATSRACISTSSQPLTFGANGINGEQMRISQNGNFIINSTTDDTVNKLQVTGNGIFTQSCKAKNFALFNTTFRGGLYTYLEILGSGTDYGTTIYSESGTGMGNIYFCGNGSATKQMIINTTGVITINNLAGTGSRAVLADASGNLSAPVSDQSVKENVQPLKYGLDTLMQLKPVQFEYINSHKNYGEGLQIGNIAQDVEKIIPEAVFVTPSTGLKGIDYNQFNGIYIKAIQEQQKIIEGLIERIEQLEKKY